MIPCITHIITGMELWAVRGVQETVGELVRLKQRRGGAQLSYILGQN